MGNESDKKDPLSSRDVRFTDERCDPVIERKFRRFLDRSETRERDEDQSVQEQRRHGEDFRLPSQISLTHKYIAFDKMENLIIVELLTDSVWMLDSQFLQEPQLLFAHVRMPTGIQMFQPRQIVYVNETEQLIMLHNRTDIFIIGLRACECATHFKNRLI